MKKLSLRTIRRTLIAMMITLSCMTATASAANVLTADKKSVSGTTTLGIDGKFVSEPQKAIAKINEIRKEACAQGIVHPSTGEKLTMADYKPVQWSSDMEYIARIRAAEASLTIDHVRTDDSSCFDIKSPSGQLAYSEVLAWTWDESMLNAIALWYDEKSDYIAADGVGDPYEIGHYATMINPKYTYVGLATFCSTSASYYTTTCGEFSKNPGTSTTPMPTYSSCTQLLNIKDSYISSSDDGVAVVKISGSKNSHLRIVSDAAVMSAVREGTTTDHVETALPTTWSSSDAQFTLKKTYAVYTKYIGKGGTVKIPKSITVNGKKLPVTEIAPNAFKNKAGKKVTTLQIGSNIKKIGANAFNGCKKIKKVTILSKNIKTIGSGAFKNVSKKAAIKVPGAAKKSYKKLLKKAGFTGSVK